MRPQKRCLQSFPAWVVRSNWSFIRASHAGFLAGSAHWVNAVALVNMVREYGTLVIPGSQRLTRCFLRLHLLHANATRVFRIPLVGGPDSILLEAAIVCPKAVAEAMWPVDHRPS
jgi:hypothetical protein